MDNLNEEIKTEKNSKSNLVLNIILGVCFLLIFSCYLFGAPTREKDLITHISSSDSLTKISNDLKNKKVVRYSYISKILVYIFSGDKLVPSGDYLFKKGENVFSVSGQLSRGKHGVEPIRVTFKEGISREDMANLLADKIPSFRKDLFLSDERSKDGYLFPDTYFFFPLSTTDEILDEITKNFSKKILSIDKELKASGKSLSDIIVMASILEKEASGKNDISLISGILWKRTELGMPLQVDAAPSTYKEIGLPDTPISNPGLLSIKAAIDPKSSPYLFYLHDHNGQVHFAFDFNGHRSNIAKYLK